MLLGRRRSEWVGWAAGIALAGWVLPWWLGIAFADQNLQLAFAAVAVLLAAPALCARTITHLGGAALACGSFLVLMALDAARIWHNTGGQMVYVAPCRMFVFGLAASLAGVGAAAAFAKHTGTAAQARMGVWILLGAGYFALQALPAEWRWEFMAALQPGAPGGVFWAVTAALAAVYLIFSSFSTRPSRM